MGIWGALGGDKNVLLASTIAHSIAAPFYLISVFFACWHCCCARKENEGIVFMNFCTFPFFILALAGAASSGLLSDFTILQPE